MTEIPPAEAVRAVALAYEGAARAAADNQFITVGIPREGSKTYENCREVYGWCKANGIELGRYFRAVFAMYRPEVCIRHFGGRPYPPFGVASSVKVLARFESSLPKAKPIREDAERIVTDIAETIRRHPAEHWNNILNSVYSYLPYDLRLAVQEKLDGGMQNANG